MAFFEICFTSNIMYFRHLKLSYFLLRYWMIFIYTIKSFALTNGSVKCEGKLLNDIIHPRPKLKQDLINVLLIFQRYPIALVCNIAKMSLRICSIDQPYQRILRSLKQMKNQECCSSL